LEHQTILIPGFEKRNGKNSVIKGKKTKRNKKNEKRKEIKIPKISETQRNANKGQEMKQN
jgi:hypothetical protein